jgi:Glycosyl hydrolase family 12
VRHAWHAGAVVAVTVLVGACGSSDPPRPDVSLLPTDGATSQVWHWTPRCTFAPAASEGCGTSGPMIGFGQLNGNAWNLGGPANAGSLDMSVGAKGEVTIVGKFARTAPCTESACLAPKAFTWVRGYPNVLYGIDQCHAGTSPRPSPRLPLPMRLDSIQPHLIGVTDYSAQTPRVTYDVAYDLWLQPTGTRQPCTSQGTLEIMVWTDYNARALLPASLQVGTASIPLAVNGAARPSTRPWTIYASNIERNGRTAPWGGTLWFVPDQADLVHSGRVRVDLSAVLSTAGLLLHANYGWPDFKRRYWLDTASFGIEFGPPSGDPMDPGPSRFSARISAYCLDVGTTLPDAACGPNRANAG